MIETSARPERAYLIGVLLPGISEVEMSGEMRELEELTRTAGAEVVGSVIQRRSVASPAHFVGRGKVQELAQAHIELGFDLLICNEDLSPRQQRNLEAELKLRVVDRTELILDIFAQHARTREGGMQVESAQLHHLLPRLIGAWDYHRQGGGVGTRGGPGEQQIEVERRRIRKRLRALDRELDQVRAQRGQQRAGRSRVPVPTFAIVGYTNAGKSTVLNVLTGAGVRAENLLFATLDPTTRRLRLPGGREVVLTDTVGFIQKLPTDLVAAFRATLEEVSAADGILHVVDASSPDAVSQAATVDRELIELNAGGKPRLVLLNKVDILGVAGRRRILQVFSELYNHVVPLSATTGFGLDELLEAMDQVPLRSMTELQLLVPYGQEMILTQLREVGGVDRTEFTEAGTRAWVHAPLESVHRFKQYRVS
ncbi:MAG TPA: GTPase HflX [Candidatus Acidoferrales bacterium]|nr:GTPase HflX [Candidatus Acidoferrales bacterium]